VKPVYRDVSGILLLDKPPGLSSNQSLQKARRVFEARKAGHTGSLDPLATGLLPICFGEATKVAGFLLGSRKAYAAECLLGVTTNTDDAEGEVIARAPVPALNDAAIEAVLATLRGRIVQTPPAFSAIKQGGVALYKRARRGEEVKVPPREVEVDRFELIERAGDSLRLYVECGSGTYVRSLVRDLGDRLGCGAHLTTLRRLWVAPFCAPIMYTLESLQAMKHEQGVGAIERLLLPLEAGLEALPALALSAEQAVQLQQGKRLMQTALRSVPLARALDAQRHLVALIEVDAAGEARVRRGFRSPA